MREHVKDHVGTEARRGCLGLGVLLFTFPFLFFGLGEFIVGGFDVAHSDDLQCNGDAGQIALLFRAACHAFGKSFMESTSIFS